MVEVGKYNELKVLRFVDFGVYLDDGEAGILLPKRYVHDDTEIGEVLKVFVYHDGDERLIATTELPAAEVGDIVKLKVKDVTPQGAFLDWGVMKDLFVPKSQQLDSMRPQGEYLVKIYIDEQTGRIAATERIEQDLQNDDLTVAEMDPVRLIVLRRSDIGYVVIINERHTGVLHHNEIYRSIAVGDKFDGFIKKIYEPDEHNKKCRIDVVAGKMGYDRVEDEADKILRLLKEHEGRLAFHDKSAPEDVYEFFGMSKKTFKMTLGKLYREKKILLEKDGFSLV